MKKGLCIVGGLYRVVGVGAQKGVGRLGTNLARMCVLKSEGYGLLFDFK